MASADGPASRPDMEKLLLVDAVVKRFEKVWQNGGRPAIDDFLPEDGPDRLAVLIELVHVDLEWRRRAGESARDEDYRERYPELAPFTSPTHVHESPHRGHVNIGSTVLPQQIGRYRVEKILGRGGFGVVYLAHDDQLSRPVAIKVPHPKLVAGPEDAKAYLTEARTVANLDHPNIVPVHDVGSTPDYPCFIVSKFIEGSTLAQKIKEDRPSFGEATELVATIAEALHYAHKKGLVHRDIKPGNIMIDTSGKPSVVDFGLALRDENVGRGPKYAGTPIYMSPEQARGEGHRVDGRSDVFSLGVVFYELLTGRRPFKADSQAELMEQITTFEPRPPRQIDDTIPKELDRICLKAISKRATERYSAAKDMADDLRHFLNQSTHEERMALGARIPSAVPPTPTPVSTPVPTPATAPASDSRPLKIVPKGLRSFDAYDADFFLELLPGPRDRDELPDSIRFWKTRIEETDSDNTFAVGLIYGPSGCGKSSLVKAGLLPRLSHDVLTVYIEATAAETETRLLNGLRKKCPALAPLAKARGEPGALATGASPGETGAGSSPVAHGIPPVANAPGSPLKQTLAALRRGQGIPAGKKVLIVLDQFEQWLHALASRERKRPELEQADLLQALRQCDGSRVQCIVMVRDDFWMAATRFMRELEIKLLEGQNSAVVDLFDIDHATKVLAAFGRAFGKLPENRGETSKEQKQFLEQAVSGLAEEGKVICVRLALFADMMKGRRWTPATMKDVGGTQGIGLTFLEETFSTASAPPEHRHHQKAARAVLKALLPESGSDIKGHMRYHAELLEASGYGSRPKDFEDLIRILDSEIRLITPTEEVVGDGRRVAGERHPPPTTRFYQLTHDYLVPSLRDWLTRKQKETRRGRAELRLGERAALWTVKPENRHLPAWWEWANIRLFTRKRDWTTSQRQMMRKATRYHAARGLVLAVILALFGWGIYEGHGRLEAHALRNSLLRAETAKVPSIIDDMAPYRAWIDPLLRDSSAEAKANQDAPKQLHVSLALLPVDAAQVEYLYGRLLDAEPHEFPVIRDALCPHRDALLDKLWAVAETPDKGKESQRLRAASALAKYDPESQRWAKVQEAVSSDLVNVPAVYLAAWMDGLRPVRAKLVAPLSDIYRSAKRRDVERSLAADLLADYTADQPQVLADLVMDADEKQFAVLFPKLKDHGERGLALVQGELAKQLPPDAKDDAKEMLAKRQANAAVAMLMMNQPEKVWPLLKHSPDPRVRTYLIHRFGPLGADATDLVKRLDEEPDVTIRRALLLSLGEFGEKEFSANERKVLLPKLQETYRTGTDPGLHASAEWLLRQWGQEAWLKQVNEEWAKDKEQREKKLEGLKHELEKASRVASAPGVPPAVKPQWYVNGQGQTMVVIPGPVEFMMGSPPEEEGRRVIESLHRRRIGRTFAIAAKPVTVGEYRRLNKSYTFSERVAPTPDCPAINTSWHQAAAYCNWLSKQEGIGADQQCYEISPQGQVTALKANYLSLTGYRLPTEAESEYACRVGAVTTRYYGETEELLGKYGWFIHNSGDRSWPVGSKKPNDFGLFDMHGNVWCWCQEAAKDYPQGESGKVIEDNEYELGINNQSSRVLRGGSFVNPASTVRSANRYSNVPTAGIFTLGFRVARTLPLDSFTALPLTPEGGRK